AIPTTPPRARAFRRARPPTAPCRSPSGRGSREPRVCADIRPSDRKAASNAAGAADLGSWTCELCRAPARAVRLPPERLQALAGLGETVGLDGAFVHLRRLGRLAERLVDFTQLEEHL